MKEQQILESKNGMQVVIPEGTDKVEVIIREVSEVNELEVKPPVKINLKGVIGSVVEFLKQRRDQPDQINQKRCHILVDREEMTIGLTFNENDEYTTGSVVGKLELHPQFVKFGINDNEESWEPNKLGQFFKMNRSFFEDKKENMDLVSKLKNFESKVNALIEQQKEDKGSVKDNYSAVVDSNLPDSFKLSIPLVKGGSPETIEVEFYHTISGRNVFLQLISPEAADIMEEVRNNAIDKEISSIRELCPEIAIIER